MSTPDSLQKSCSSIDLPPARSSRSPPIRRMADSCYFNLVRMAGGRSTPSTFTLKSRPRSAQRKVQALSKGSPAYDGAPTALLRGIEPLGKLCLKNCR